MHILKGSSPQLDASDLARIEIECASDILVMSLVHDLLIAHEAERENEDNAAKVEGLEVFLEEVREELKNTQKTLEEVRELAENYRKELEETQDDRDGLRLRMQNARNSIEAVLEAAL
jgi:septal ring factor EnvC (AmiA/AmiB activator)